MSPTKRQKLSDGTPADAAERNTDLDDNSESGITGSEGTLDDTDEIAMSARKSQRTAKRKIRATGTSRFGATLESLLNTETPSARPLSLKPSVSRKRNDEKLGQRAQKIIQAERKQKEDIGRIKDVIGGWGGESERALRKVAQRGVVKLFNAIQQSQATESVAAEEARAARGSGKPTLPAPLTHHKSKRKQKARDKDNIIGRGKESTVNKNDFFDMIRTGGIVSKA